MSDIGHIESEFQEVRAAAMEKGYLTLEDIFREYRAATNDLDQLARDLKSIAENRPDMDINPDVSLERARLEAVKPPSYDAWLDAQQEREPSQGK